MQGTETVLTSQRSHVEALIMRRFLPFALVGALALSTACDRSVLSTDVTAEQEVNYLRAKKLYDQQDFQAAAEFYKKTLSVNPDFARAHLELGLLCEDKLDDSIGAIYHYRRYLELKPDSEKRQLVEDFIERAKLSMAAKLPQPPAVEPGELARLQNEKAALLQENATLRSRVAELEKSITVAAPTGIEAPPTVVATAPTSMVTPGPVTAPAIIMASPPVTMLVRVIGAAYARRPKGRHFAIAGVALLWYPVCLGENLSGQSERARCRGKDQFLEGYGPAVGNSVVG